MRRALKTCALAAALLVPLGPGSTASAQVNIQFQWGTRQRPLAGQRFEAMRTLAHELDGRANHARDEVAANSRRSRRERRLLAAVDDFARRAADFHQRMDAYAERRWDLPPTVEDLRARAQDVNEKFRDVPVFAHVADDWNAALETVDQMERVLQGQNVAIVQPRHWDHDRDYDQHEQSYQRWQGNSGELPRAGYGGEASRQGPVPADEMRALTDRLVQAARTARQEAGHWEDPFGDGHARSLDHLVDLAQQLQQAAGSGDARNARPLIDHMRNDLRRGEPHLRATPALKNAAASWDQMQRILDRMDQVVR